MVSGFPTNHNKLLSLGVFCVKAEGGSVRGTSANRHWESTKKSWKTDQSFSTGDQSWARKATKHSKSNRANSCFLCPSTMQMDILFAFLAPSSEHTESWRRLKVCSQHSTIGSVTTDRGEFCLLCLFRFALRFVKFFTLGFSSLSYRSYSGLHTPFIESRTLVVKIVLWRPAYRNIRSKSGHLGVLFPLSQVCHSFFELASWYKFIWIISLLLRREMGFKSMLHTKRCPDG